MKTKNIEQIPKIQRRLLSALAGFALICSGLGAQAQDLIVNSFDNDGGGTFGLDWANFRDYAYSVNYTFDATQDSTGNPSSGSMYLTVNWPLQTDPSWNENWNDIQLAFGTPVFVSSDYINFDVDIKVDVTNSSLSADTWSYGAVELIVNNPWVNVVGWVNLAPTAEWQHLSGAFSGIPSGTYSEAVIGFISNGGSSPTGPVSVWIDNIRFTAPMTVFTNRPTLSLAKAPPAGLTCICSQSGDAWQRQMVQTVNSNYSWYGHTPTTYSMNIAACPGVNYPGFESQMFLIPGAGLVAGGSVDWYSANVVNLFVERNPDGTGVGTFQYKVNDPSDWNSPALVVTQPCATGPVGNWILTFNNNTNVTLTAPNNSHTNFTIPDANAALFQDPLFVYVGTLPNGGGNIGQSSTFSQVQVSGSAGSINDTFASLNTNTWALYVEDAPGVFVTTTDAKYWVTWPLPDYGATNGFTSLYASDNLKTQLSSSHSLPTADTGWINVGSATRLTIVKQSTLNTAFGYAPTNCFFGLFHQ